jgi:hypothetical protein
MKSEMCVALYTQAMNWMSLAADEATTDTGTSSS